MSKDTLGNIFFVLASVLAVSMVVTHFCYMFGLYLSWRSSVKLMRLVRNVSENTFQFLFGINTNSSYVVLPHLTVNRSRFIAFVQSEDLNTNAEIKQAKLKWQAANVLIKRTTLIWWCMFGIGIVIGAALVTLASNGWLNT